MLRLNTRVKLLLTLSISSITLFTDRIMPLLLLCALAAAALMLFSENMRGSLALLRKVAALGIILFTLQLVFVRTGERIAEISMLFITYDGLYNGTALLLRLLTLSLSALLLRNEKPGELAAAFALMKLPYELVFMMYIGIKFLPILQEEFKYALISIQLSGADFKANKLNERLKLYIYIFAPAFSGALLRAQNISIAAEYRCFRLFPHRTNRYVQKLHYRDWAAIAAILCLSVIFVIFF